MRYFALATDYARRRTAFGKPLIEHPLHVETLADMTLQFRAGFMLAFRAVELLGKEETGEATDSELKLLRLLIPVAKLYTAKQAVAVASEALESFGGAGYVEDTGIPRLLRDAQVLPIWEGTTNVLSLDTLRAIHRVDALDEWIKNLRQRLDDIKVRDLRGSAERVTNAVERIVQYAKRATAADDSFQQVGARSLSYAIARTEAATLLLEHACAIPDRSNLVAAQRWCAREPTPLVEGEDLRRADSRHLLD